jgi:AraC-like DNA-binding protein
MTSVLIPAVERCRLSTVRVGREDAGINALEIVHAARHFAPHFFESYAFGLVESGVCRITTRHGSWVAGPGSLTMFAPGELHQADVLSAEPYGYRMVYLPADLVRQLAGVGGSSLSCAPPLQLPVVQDPAIARSFGRAHRDVMHNPGSPLAEDRLVACIRSLVRLPQPAAVGASSGDARLADAARACLAGSVGRPLYLEEVAGACGVTTFRLIRVFQRVTGVTPYAYLILLRVNAARRLLDAGATVSDAAYSCCFSDQSHLTRTFKRTLGLPPGQYLRSMRQHAA